VNLNKVDFQAMGFKGRLQNNPSIGKVHPKSTQACPLAWGNRKRETPSLHDEISHWVAWKFYS
jgi:hypothetical protein